MDLAKFYGQYKGLAGLIIELFENNIQSIPGLSKDLCNLGWELEEGTTLHFFHHPNPQAGQERRK